MGRFADDVQGHLRDALAERLPGRDWTTEFDVGGTPVDVAGTPIDAGDGSPLVAVELEWRRADPADNAAKLFRHLREGTLDGPVVVCQVFTGYYDLESGGVSSKRENAEFVGRMADRTVDAVAYHALAFGLDPPKKGGDRPDGWRKAADETAAGIESLLRDD